MKLKLISDDIAECSKCLAHKAVAEFRVCKKGTKYEYTLSYCIPCRSKQIQHPLKTNVYAFLRDRYRRLVVRARKQHIVCTITLEEFIELYDRQHGLCFYTNLPLNWQSKGLQRNSLSVDKIIPAFGYTNTNTVLCIHKANTIKSDMTIEELELWLPTWYTKVVDMWRSNGLICLQVANGNF